MSDRLRVPLPKRWTNAAAALALAGLALTVAAPSAARPATQTFTHTWNWVEKTSTGYYSLATLSAGSFVRVDRVPILPGFTLRRVESTCAFDPKTDVLAPLSLSMTNLTPSFSAELSTLFENGGNQELRSLFSIEVLYSTGAECVDMSYPGGDQWNPGWRDPVLPGQTVGPIYAYAILTNYFSPQHPRGDPALLSNLILSLGLMSPRATLVSLTGPGLFMPLASRLIPLSGHMSCHETLPPPPPDALQYTAPTFSCS